MLPVIGMSPGNSYFKDKAVAFLLREAIKRYGKALVMVADVPATSTYLAMGYQLTKAQSKARLNGNNLKNRTQKVISDLGIDAEKVTIIDRETEIENNPLYVAQRDRIQKLYESNNAFHESVNSTSKEVLVNSQKDFTEDGIKQAAHYLLSEIAFIECIGDICGEDQIDYLYHKPWRVFEDYIAGVFDGQIKQHLDFILLEAPFETYLSLKENNLTRYELIQQRGSIKCTFVPYIKDYFSVNSDGTYSGLFYDIISNVAKNNNLSLDFVEQSGYGVVAERLNGGFADIFCAPIRPDKDRRLEMFFSESLGESKVFAYINPTSLYAEQSLESMKENHKLRIVVKENDIHHDIVKEHFPHARIVRLPQLASIGEEIQYVLDNRADMTFWEDKLTEDFLKQHNYASGALKKKGRGDDNHPVEIYDNCFALPRGEFELKGLIDEEIQKHKETA